MDHSLLRVEFHLTEHDTLASRGCLPSLALLVMFASCDVFAYWQRSSTLIIAIILFYEHIPHLLDKTPQPSDKPLTVAINLLKHLSPQE